LGKWSRGRHYPIETNGKEDNGKNGQGGDTAAALLPLLSFISGSGHGGSARR
jgi:hypothetical protein